MEFRRRHAHLFALGLTCCFPEAGQKHVNLPENAHLDVQDARGVAWPAGAIPRQPALRLWFDSPSHGDDAAAVWLLAGPSSEALREDLGSSHVREHTAAQMVDVTLTRSARFVELRPTGVLAADAAYSLVWSNDHGRSLRALRTAANADAGAALRESLPAQGARDVPLNQNALFWWFDGTVQLPADATVTLLHDDSTESLPLDNTVCESLGFGANRCLRALLSQPLTPQSQYRATLPDSLRDGAGAALVVGSLAFESAARSDGTAPMWLPARCTADEIALDGVCMWLDEGHVQLRARSDEPVILTLAGCGVTAAALTVLSELSLTAARADTGPCPLVLRLRNGTGAFCDRALSLPAAPALAQLSIDEVRADPLGAEPDQEYVELLNFGTETVALAGFTLARDGEMRGVALDDSASIDPGERVLAVAPSFRARAGDGDVEPAASVRLVRLLAALNLASSGTALSLRDATGRRVSAAPAITAGEPGACITRHGADPRSNEASAFEVDPHVSCTPGAPTAWP